jgi:hypothetical protein
VIAIGGGCTVDDNHCIGNNIVYVPEGKLHLVRLFEYYVEAFGMKFDGISNS